MKNFQFTITLKDIIISVWLFIVMIALLVAHAAYGYSWKFWLVEGAAIVTLTGLMIWLDKYFEKKK